MWLGRWGDVHVLIALCNTCREYTDIWRGVSPGEVHAARAERVGRVRRVDAHRRPRLPEQVSVTHTMTTLSRIHDNTWAARRTDSACLRAIAFRVSPSPLALTLTVRTAGPRKSFRAGSTGVC